MRKFILSALLATSSLAVAAAPAWADEAATAEKSKEAANIEQVTKMFANLFDTKDATPIDAARLALAKTTTAKIMPDGIYSRVMKGMTDKIFGALFSTGNGMSDLEITLTTGVEVDASAFDDAKRQAVTAILDPNHTERSTAMASALNPMFDKMAAIVEGPMREGLARAYARKFSAEQLTELNAFLATPTGSFYASESFALQADPEVMQAVFSALPQLMEGLSSPEGIEKDITAKMAAIPEPRKLADLSDKDLTDLAKLLGTTVKDLKAFNEADSVTDASDYAAEAAADAAADAAAADPFANESGTEPWWDRDNWSKADQEKISQLEDRANKLGEQSSAASEAALNFETEVMLRVRKAYLAKGWKPSESSE